MFWDGGGICKLQPSADEAFCGINQICNLFTKLRSNLWKKHRKRLRNAKSLQIRGFPIKTSPAHFKAPEMLKTTPTSVQPLFGSQTLCPDHPCSPWALGSGSWTHPIYPHLPHRAGARPGKAETQGSELEENVIPSLRSPSPPDAPGSKSRRE